MRIFLKGFKFAFRGIVHCFLYELNFRIHTFVAAYVLFFAPFFLTSKTQWAVLILTIALVLMAEAINTSIENLINLVCPNQNPIARVVKDVAAGAVLLSAFASVFIGFLLFWKPDIWYNLVLDFVKSPIKLLGIILSLILSLLIIIFGGKEDKNKK